MGYFFFMTACCLLVPLTMALSGHWLDKNPPKEINGLLGYRTKRSRKSADAWNFAQHLCGKIWVKWGLIQLPVSLLAMLPFLKSGIDVVSIAALVVMTAQILVMIASIYPVERALRRNFDENGVCIKQQ